MWRQLSRTSHTTLSVSTIRVSILPVGLYTIRVSTLPGLYTIPVSTLPVGLYTIVRSQLIV
jgi:hypothetical protein